MTVASLRLESGQEPATRFIEGLDRQPRAKVLALLGIYADLRDMRNPQKFKKVEGTEGIFEFKDFQVRLLCFTAPGGRLLLVDGEIKQTQKLSPQLIRRAVQARREYLETIERARSGRG